jgi:aminobenzoyl-glutamate utilization protein B
VLQRQLERVGPPRFDDAEREFARRTQVDLTDPPEAALFEEVLPLPDAAWHMRASTDVGNVSWRVPTGGLTVASYTHGAPGHSWQVVACTGMSIGEKGMFVAARTLAGAALEMLGDPQRLTEARQDFETRRQEREAPQSVLPADQNVPTAIR